VVISIILVAVFVLVFGGAGMFCLGKSFFELLLSVFFERDVTIIFSPHYAHLSA
jgi:hypothetical protein